MEDDWNLSRSNVTTTMYLEGFPCCGRTPTSGSQAVLCNNNRQVEEVYCALCSVLRLAGKRRMQTNQATNVPFSFPNAMVCHRSQYGQKFVRRLHISISDIGQLTTDWHGRTILTSFENQMQDIHLLLLHLDPKMKALTFSASCTTPKGNFPRQRRCAKALASGSQSTLSINSRHVEQAEVLHCVLCSTLQVPAHSYME